MSKLTKKFIAMLLSGILVIGSATSSVLAESIDLDPSQTSEIAQDAFTEEETEDLSEAPATVGDASEKSYTGDMSAEEAEEAAQYYTVTLDANGGYFENEWDDSIGDYKRQAEVVEKQIPVDGTVTSFPVFANPDSQTMVFAGWSLERDGELATVGDEEYAPVDNCVLYAVWNIESDIVSPTDSYESPESNGNGIDNKFNIEDGNGIFSQKDEENTDTQQKESESTVIFDSEEQTNDVNNSSFTDEKSDKENEISEEVHSDASLHSFPQGYDYDESTNTLTLTDYIGGEFLNTAVGTTQIYVEGNLNIVLNGSNKLVFGSEYGIYCEGNLSISGNGSLEIANVSTGIYAGREISIENVSITISDTTSGIVANYGDVAATNASITMNNKLQVKNGGNFMMNGGSTVASHIECSDFILDSGNITAAIKTSGNIEVNDGIIDATLKGDNYDDIYFGIESDGSSILIKGGELFTNCSYSLSAIEAPNADMTVSGGKIKAEGSWCGVSLRSFSMSGGEATITCDEGSGMACPATVTGGKLTVDVKKAGGYSGGIDGGLTLEGGNVSISSNTSGIIGETTVNGGNLVVNGGTYGLYGKGYGPFNFHGGEIYITGDQQAMEMIKSIDVQIPFETGKSQEKALYAEEYLGERYIHLSESGNIRHDASSDGIVAVGQNTVYEMLNGEGWNFDSNKRILKLSNYIGSSSYTDASDIIQIYSDGDLHIIVEGQNSISIESDYGIYCEGNLTISGSGNLDIANVNTGIYAGREISIENVSITIGDTTSGIVANYGDVAATNASITMNNRLQVKNGGNFMMNGGSTVASHIECSDFILDSGNITAAIKTSGNIEVNDGIIDATLKNENYDDIYFGIESDGSSILIKGGELFTNCSYSLSAIEAPDADMTVSGGKIKAEGSWCGVSLRSFSMSGGEATIICDEGSGMACPATVTGGKLTVDVKKAGGYSGGIDGGLTLEGGNVSISSNTSGIIGETTVNGGNLVVNGGTYGLYGNASKSFIINGGECKITGKDQAAYPITGFSLGITMELMTGASSANEKTAEKYLGEKYIHLLEKTSGLEIKKASIEVIPDQIYSGNPIKPNLIVKYGEKVLKNNSDYTTSYKDNINVGTATITITGKGNYIGTHISSFKIGPAPISTSTITGLSAKTYTGKALVQAPTVKIGSTTLTRNTDYTISYKNNTNAGTATLTITGKGNYAGTKSATFKINKASQSITAKLSASSIAVGKTATVSITGNKGTKSYKSSNSAIATVTSAGKVTAKKVGTVTITATSTATSNYNAASKKLTIKVVPAATSSITAANQSTGIKLTWKKVTGATGYEVYSGSTLIKTIKSGSTVTCIDTKANTNGTKYTFKIVPTASTGNGTAKSLTTYRVARPAISSVKNNATKKINVKWGKNAKANGYQIQYSTSKAFASGNKTASITSVTTVSKVIGSLAKGKTYYVRIRTYKTVGKTKYWSTWSAVKSVKISK